MAKKKTSKRRTTKSANGTRNALKFSSTDTKKLTAKELAEHNALIRAIAESEASHAETMRGVVKYVEHMRSVFERLGHAFIERQRRFDDAAETLVPGWRENRDWVALARVLRRETNLQVERIDQLPVRRLIPELDFAINTVRERRAELESVTLQAAQTILEELKQSKANQLLTMDQVATQLRCSGSSVYRRMNEGLPYSKVGGERLVKQSDLNAFIEKSD